MTYTFEDQADDIANSVKGCKVAQGNILYDLQPGNATRYLVLFACLPGEVSTFVMTVTNFHRCPSMIVSAEVGAVVPSYVAEKLNLGIRDAEQLAALIRWHLKATSITRDVVGSANADGLITAPASALYGTPRWDPTDSNED